MSVGLSVCPIGQKLPMDINERHTSQMLLLAHQNYNTQSRSIKFVRRHKTALDNILQKDVIGYM